MILWDKNMKYSKKEAALRKKPDSARCFWLELSLISELLKKVVDVCLYF